jgi:ferrochelatase
VVVPVGFVSDHMEVRHDLDAEAAQRAGSLGLAFARAATPGCHPRFVSMITELVRERLALPDTGTGEGLVSAGGLDQDCPADCCRYAAPAGRPAGASRA